MTKKVKVSRDQQWLEDALSVALNAEAYAAKALLDAQESYAKAKEKATETWGRWRAYLDRKYAEKKAA